MTAGWVRRDFEGSPGVTQYRPGRYFEAVRDHFRGRALLCIDVSLSMQGAPLRAAVTGGLDFLDEAGRAHYECGLVLWTATVEAHLPTSSPPEEVRRRLRGARLGYGTKLSPTLRAAIRELGHLSGDRVVCVFSDGDITDARAAASLAAAARRRGIRFVVRGLGTGTGRNLASVLGADPEDRAQTIEQVGDLRAGIASMVQQLRRSP